MESNGPFQNSSLTNKRLSLRSKIKPPIFKFKFTMMLTTVLHSPSHIPTSQRIQPFSDASAIHPFQPPTSAPYPISCLSFLSYSYTSGPTDPAPNHPTTIRTYVKTKMTQSLPLSTTLISLIFALSRIIL